MTPPRDPTLHELRDCGCCAGTGAVTPLTIANRPGLPSIAYRVGTHGAFKRSLLAALSEARHPALQRLNAREDDDFAIALLDAWATVADVLTFYSERIANESYLRTATERRSVLELARAIGYELDPGVAASAPLAFTLEDAPGAPLATVVEPGTKVQSVPKPGELPQIFETVETLDARAEWNALRPRQSVSWTPAHGDLHVYLAGIATGLRPGDALLIVGDERKANPGSERWDVRQVVSVEPDPDLDVTRVTWERGLGKVDPFVAPAAQNAEVYVLRQRVSLFGSGAPDWRTLPDTVRNRYLPTTTGTTLLDPEWPNLRLAAISFPGASGEATGPGLYGEYFDGLDFANPRLTRIDETIDFGWGSGSPDPSIGVDTFSVRWTGKVVPAFSETYTFFTLSDDGVRLYVDGKLLIDNWTDHGATENSGTIALQANRQYDLVLEFYENTGAAVIRLSWSSPSQPKQIVPRDRLQIPYDVHLGVPVPQIVPGSWVVLAGPAYEELYEVVEAEESSRQGYALASKTTRLRLRGENLAIFDDQVRAVAALGESVQLATAERPLTTPVTGTTIELDRLAGDLPPGRALLVSGRRMRVRVEGVGLQLVSLDGRVTRALVEDEVLLVTAAPPASVGATQTWPLVDATGLEGTVAAPAGALVLVPAADDDPLVSERATLEVAEPIESARTRLTLTTSLRNLFDRGTVTIAANVATATHGEAKSEVLGSGSAAVPFQHFGLRDLPLTYVPADTPSGGASTLEVRVDDVRWEEVPSLYGRGPRERVYVTRIDDGGRATVEFGDGENGARPPSGQENVRAAYRKGTGSEGNVDVGQLSLLLTRPLGVKAVANPLPATGGQDPQALADARANAPLTVLTLERIVSLRDYEDFARTFGGISKASATWTWNVDRRGVLVTVAGVDGAALAADDPVRDRLLVAMARAGDPHVPVQVRSYRPVAFRLATSVERDDAYDADLVRAAVEAALQTAFSFAARAFGQPVTLSEVVAVVQSVPGVVAADIDLLYRGPTPAWSSFLPADSPRPGDDAAAALAAELLLLDLRPGDVTVRA
jgi:predicted phage baseplate assembly protein